MSEPTYKDYNAVITKTTDNNITVKEKIKIKNFSSAAVLNEVFPDDGEFIVKPSRISLVNVHNEHAKDDKDYSVLVIETENGDSYRSSSTSLIESVFDIVDELESEGEHVSDYEFKFYKIKSKNNNGFLLQATLN